MMKILIVKKPQLAVRLVLALLIVSQLGETIYLPALPAIRQSLACSSSEVQSILGWFLCAYGALQFLYGPLSDRFGRRGIILLSIGVFLIGTVGAATAKTIYQLWISTVVMGAGIGSGGLMCRTVLRDLYTGIKLQNAYSLGGVTLVFVPIVAPVVGAYVLCLWDWRAIFWLMGACGALLGVVLWALFEETNPYKGHSAFSWSAIVQGYRTVVTHPAFIGNAVCVSANCAALMAYETVMPFLLQIGLGFTPVQYGWLMILPVTGFFLGSLWNARLAHHLRLERITQRGLWITWLAAALLLFSGLVWQLSVSALLIPMFLVMLGSGVLFASTTAGALSPFPKMAGIAGASLGGLQNMSAGFSTLLVALLPTGNQVPMAIAILCLTGVSQLAFSWFMSVSEANNIDASETL